MEKYTLYIKPDFKVGKVLVVYYSLSGKTEKIAEQIAELTGGDLYKIKTEEEIKLGSTFYIKARKQLYSGQYPKIVKDWPDFKKYDTIFVGGPVWWYAPATPLLAFLKKADFNGKKVVPFSTQGSNYGGFYTDFNKLAKNAKLRQYAAFNNMSEKYDQRVKHKIVNWINSIK